ncbi:outer membrane beta-barrel protein [Catenovulum adriaticum]|uniref:Outer membrane beta-barrel protein n=1 Tax=Catenovulum adriaticum TaxID=2984846 RepID=A0ABY7AN51_9ALTE|nr:outer membrane beta-barrel protein [Catenovulum sp. TS8]WAJ70985.1 outer membrane beta-barrel protein [Catenovulum sp. TS8]
MNQITHNSLINKPSSKATLYPSVFYLVLFSSSQLSAEPQNGFAGNLSAGAHYDDNIFRLDNEEITDTYYRLSPNLKLTGLAGKHRFRLNYFADYNQYNQYENLNYNEHQIIAIADLDHSYRSQSEFKLRYYNERETPGSNDAPNDIRDEFNLRKGFAANAKFSYGRYASTGQLVISGEHLNLNYTNNQQFFRDYNRNSVNATFYYRVAPKSRVLLEARWLDYQYDPTEDYIDKSSQKYIFLAGYEWRLTEQTKSTIKIGYQNQTYQADNLSDLDNLSFEVATLWRANEYSQYGLSAKRETRESSLINRPSYIRNSLKLNLNYNLSQRSQLNIDLSMLKDELNPNDNIEPNTEAAEPNENHRYQANLIFNYELSYNLETQINYTFNNRKADNELNQYTANQIGLTLNAKF